MPSALSALFRAWWVRLSVRSPRPVVAPPPAEFAEVNPSPVAAVTLEEPVIAESETTVARATVETAPPVRPAPEVDPVLRFRTLESLENLQQIPALQSLAQGFVRATARTDSSVDEVVAAVEKDPALCVRVLRMANSAFVSSEQKIEDIFTAVQMLGLQRVSTLAHALFTMRDASKTSGGLDWRHLWMHALATAAIAEEIEKQLGQSAGQQLYLAALLHDVGKIVLSTVTPDAYREVMDRVWAGDGRLDALELDNFGVGHSEAGVIFAEQSGLPDEVVAAIAHHADPAQAEKYRFTVAVVGIANYLSKSYGLGFSGARLDETDGDLESLSAWGVIAQETGTTPNVSEIADAVHQLVASLKRELQGLREAA